ncbi:MAG: hypothetical protein ABIR78_07710 [Ferruginibacter sp.]
MKKIFTMILFAAGLSFAASAQNWDGSHNQNPYPVYQQNDNWNQNGQQQSRDYGYNNRRGRNDDYNRQRRNDDYNRQGCNDDYNRQGRNDDYNRQGRNNDYNRQAECDRMNQEYDRRIDVYRNDRRMNGYERNRRIQEAEYERQQKNKAFGTGVVVGGIAAILLGVIIAGGR